MSDIIINDIKISGGPEVRHNSKLLLLYKIALSREDLVSGNYIESTWNPDIPILVKVAQSSLLRGIYEGILGMHGGGSVRQIEIPPEKAFGSRGYGSIPKDSSLFVEICAVSVDND